MAQRYRLIPTPPKKGLDAYELERICKEKEIGMSVDSVIKVAKTIVTIRVNLPNLGEKYLKTIFTTEKQCMLAPLFRLADYPQTDGIITLL